MKKATLSLLALAFAMNVFCGSKPVYSPFPSQQDAKQIISRPILIEMREVDEKSKQKLEKSDPDHLSFLNEYNEYYNSTMVEFFKAEFNGSKDIQLKSTSEIEQIIKSKSNQYTIIRNGVLSRSFDVSGMKKSKDVYSIFIVLPEIKKSQLIISFNTMILNDVDFLFLVQQMNSCMSRAIAGKGSLDLNEGYKVDAKLLKDKKLIITDNVLNDKLTLDDIKKAYQLEIEYIEDLNRFSEIVLNKEKGYAYITSSFSEIVLGTSFNIVDTETGNILMVMSLGTVVFDLAYKPSRENNPHMSAMDRRKYSVSLFTFWPKNEMKEIHFKSLYKSAMQK